LLGLDWKLSQKSYKPFYPTRFVLLYEYELQQVVLQCVCEGLAG
jgi:hypothetical protein